MPYDKALQLIKHYESLHDGDLKAIGLQPKLCPAGIVTVGWGYALFDKSGLPIKDMAKAKLLYPELMTINEAKAEQLLKEVYNSFEQSVKRSVTVPLNDFQLGACVSLSYNIGLQAFRSSSVVRLLNVGKYNDAAEAFLLWNKATVNGVKKELNGLTLRRKSERHLFLFNEFKPFNS